MRFQKASGESGTTRSEEAKMPVVYAPTSQWKKSNTSYLECLSKLLFSSSLTGEMISRMVLMEPKAGPGGCRIFPHPIFDTKINLGKKEEFGQYLANRKRSLMRLVVTELI